MKWREVALLLLLSSGISLTAAAPNVTGDCQETEVHAVSPNGELCTIYTGCDVPSNWSVIDSCEDFENEKLRETINNSFQNVSSEENRELLRRALQTLEEGNRTEARKLWVRATSEDGRDIPVKLIGVGVLTLFILLLVLLYLRGGEKEERTPDRRRRDRRRNGRRSV